MRAVARGGGGGEGGNEGGSAGGNGGGGGQVCVAGRTAAESIDTPEGKRGGAMGYGSKDTRVATRDGWLMGRSSRAAGPRRLAHTTRQVKGGSSNR